VNTALLSLLAITFLAAGPHLAAATSAPISSSSYRRPRYADIGPFGISTEPDAKPRPHGGLNGRKLTSVYARSFLLSSRAALMTGCTESRAAKSPRVFPASRVGLNPA
jgi:hypothetical protein